MKKLLVVCMFFECSVGAMHNKPGPDKPNFERRVQIPRSMVRVTFELTEREKNIARQMAFYGWGIVNEFFSQRIDYEDSPSKSLARTRALNQARQNPQYHPFIRPTAQALFAERVVQEWRGELVDDKQPKVIDWIDGSEDSE